MTDSRPGRSLLHSDFVDSGVVNLEIRRLLAFLESGTKSKPTLESTSQKSQLKTPYVSAQTVAYGVFDREFDFDSQEWSCSDQACKAVYAARTCEGRPGYEGCGRRP